MLPSQSYARLSNIPVGPRPGPNRFHRIALGLTPFPKTRTVKLRYCQNIDMDASAGAVTTWGFRCNDLYDPDYSGTGNQPYYFDQLMEMYEKFTVIGSKITITPFGATTTGHYYVVGIYRDVDTTPRPSTLRGAMEPPGTKWIGVGDANQNPRTLSLTYSAKKTHGGNPVDKAELTGSASASPTTSDIYRVFAGCPTPATDPGQITMNVVIEYTAVLHARKDPVGS